MDTIIKDIRYAIRSLLKRPGFTSIAIVTLALGIGANTAIFSIVNAVLLRPLPFPDPDRLVMIWEDASFAGFPRNTPAAANYADWKAQNQVFADMAARDSRSMNLTGDGEPQRIDGSGITANFFDVLGVKPVVGRNFSSEEDQPQANKVVIINFKLWQSRYGGQSNIVGRELILNGEKHTVVGVMPADFQFLNSQIGIWVPMAFTSEGLASRTRHYLTVVARLKPGVSLDQANADVRTITARIAHDHPDEAGRLSAFAMPLRDQLAGDMRRPLLVLLVAVGFVLLIACANIANLLLSRAASRKREIAVRTALGASRWRIVSQLLVESLLLSIAGSACGLLLATWSFVFLQRMVPDGLVSSKLRLDPRVLGFTALVTLLTAVLFGLAPALQASKIDLNEALKQGGGRSGLNAGGNRLRSVMVVAEVALALILLVGAGLLIQTFFKLRDQYASLRPESVLTLRTALPRNKYAEPAQRMAFYRQVLQRVKTLPGVISAGYSTSVPLVMKGNTSGFWVEGQTVEQARAGGLSYDANHRQVSSDFLNTIGIPIRRGRGFNDSDNEQAVPVAIVNETMARQYWPGQDALGKRFKLGDPAEDIPWATVVGIAADVRQMGIDQPVKPEMYFPFLQSGSYQFTAPRDLAIRTSIDPLSIAAAAQKEIHQVDPDQPISNIRTMGDVVDEETASRRFGMTLLTIFAALALLLATLGIYGVLAYFVVQHTPEIGVRMALGAQRRNILTLVLKKGMTLALLGVVIGVAGAFALTRLMSSLLYEVSTTDPLTYAGISLLLLIVAFCACYLPALRATKVDPLVALTYE